jgi:undecaprenyl-diphosphatase
VNTIQILILAAVQGVTEFLPVSSSGHLVIVESLMNTNVNIPDVNIFLHAGTLLSILVFYWNRIWKLVSEDSRVVGLLIVGTIPAVIAGLVIKRLFGHVLESPMIAGFMLPITGLMLLWIATREVGKEAYEGLTYKSALLIGLFQAIAILPGISRSGSTIVAGLIVGLKREAAATFSFLLAIPVIAGATVLEIKDMMGSSALQTDLSILLLGAFFAFVVGLVSLSWLIRWIEKGKLHYFAYWCIPLGVCIIGWQLAQTLLIDKV